MKPDIQEFHKDRRFLIQLYCINEILMNYATARNQPSHVSIRERTTYANYKIQHALRNSGLQIRVEDRLQIGRGTPSAKLRLNVARSVAD